MIKLSNYINVDKIMKKTKNTYTQKYNSLYFCFTVLTFAYHERLSLAFKTTGKDIINQNIV